MNNIKVKNLIESSKPAGRFSEWLEGTMQIRQNKGESNVPCAECSACCNSSDFIHITPSDKDAIKHIPRELTFAAPGLPTGHLLLGYDENGRCPMYIHNQCSIYQYRPQTCRQYDCRVFPATNTKVHELGKKLIAKQARRWTFEFSSNQDHKAFEAVQAAAKFISQYANYFPKDFLPSNTTQQAVLAISACNIFLGVKFIQDVDLKRTIELIVETCET